VLVVDEFAAAHGDLRNRPTTCEESETQEAQEELTI
jgi:hypothetical protein